jgi:putative ABC transport system permease protein
VTITIALGIGLLNIKDSYDATIAAHYENLNNADLRVRLNEFIPGSNLTTWLSNTTIQEAGVESLEGRIFQYASVTYNERDYKAYLIGVNFSANTINELEIEYGNFPALDTEIIIERHFDSFFVENPNSDLIGTGITLNSGLLSENFTISGLVIDSDYLYPVDEQTNYATFNGELCVAYVSLERLQSILGVSGVNEVLVKTVDRSLLANQVADNALTEVIGAGRIRNVIYWNEAPDYTFFYIDNPHDKVGIIFGIFGLIAGSTAIYNSLSKLVIAQRSHIGLYGALGAKRREVFFHYLGLGVTLSLIGIVTGWIGAGLLSITAVNMRASIHGFTVVKIGFDPLIWIGGSLFAIAVTAFFSFLATLPILRLTPREAMVASYSKSQLDKEPLLEKTLYKLRIVKRLNTIIPLRTVFMNKKRSVSTIIAVATSMIILIAAVSFTYDIIYAMDQNYNEYEKYDMNVILRGPTDEKLIKSTLRNIEGINQIEGYIGTQVFISGFNGEPIRVPLQAFHENSTLREYHIIAGNKNLMKTDLGRTSILVGSNLAEEYDIRVGETITLTFDSLNVFSLEVVGITGELMDNALLWTIEGLQENALDVQEIGITANVTGFVFSFDNDVSGDQKEVIRAQINTFFQPYVVSDTKETLRMLEMMMEMIMGLLIFVGLLGLGALILFTFSSMSLTMMDREMEFLALRAMGAKRRSILKVIFIENLLYGVSGLILGSILSTALLRPSYNYLLADMYVPVIVPPELWIIVVGSIIFCVFLSTSLLTWKTWRNSLPNMLHHRMIS